MIDEVFDWCVRVLVYWAGRLGITYKAINVWIFVVIWPLVTLALVILIVWQRARIRGLKREMEDKKGNPGLEDNPVP
jgi:hypothetical protein